MGAPRRDLAGLNPPRRPSIPAPPPRPAPRGIATANSVANATTQPAATTLEETPPTAAAADARPAVVPAAAAPPPAPEPPARSGDVGRKRKIAVSVPRAVSDRLREYATVEDRYLSDVVLDAVAAQQHDFQPQQREPAGLARRPRRARRGQQATQLFVYLTGDEIASLDELAAAVGFSRSRVVAESLDRHLPPGPTPA